MITSQEQLQKISEIVNSLDGNLLGAEKENRRRLPRMNIRLQLTVMLLAGMVPSSVDVVTRNISASGLGFVCRRMFRREERIAVLLRVPGVAPKLVLARITFGRYVTGGMYEMGSEFLESVSDARADGASGPARIPNHWHMGAGAVKTNVSAPGTGSATGVPAPAP